VRFGGGGGGGGGRRRGRDGNDDDEGSEGEDSDDEEAAVAAVNIAGAASADGAPSDAVQCGRCGKHFRGGQAELRRHQRASKKVHGIFDFRRGGVTPFPRGGALRAVVLAGRPTDTDAQRRDADGPRAPTPAVRSALIP